MTTLYRPVLIESAEQAAELPEGVMAVWTWGMGADARTHTRTGWMSRSGSVLPSSNVVGWTALVPIEAEEVRSEDYGSYHLVEALTATAPFTVYVPQEDQ